jgi:hypothetical protein
MLSTPDYVNAMAVRSRAYFATERSSA